MHGPLRGPVGMAREMFHDQCPLDPPIPSRNSSWIGTGTPSISECQGETLKVFPRLGWDVPGHLDAGADLLDSGSYWLRGRGGNVRWRRTRTTGTTTTTSGRRCTGWRCRSASSRTTGEARDGQSYAYSC